MHAHNVHGLNLSTFHYPLCLQNTQNFISLYTKFDVLSNIHGALYGHN